MATLKFETPIVYRDATDLVDDLSSGDLKGHKLEGWAYNHERNDPFPKKDWVAPQVAHPVNFLDMDDSRASSNSSVPSSPSASGAPLGTQVPNRAPPGSSTPIRQQGSSKDIHSFAEPSSQRQLELNVSSSAGAADLSYESNSSLSQAETSLGGGSLVMSLPYPPARDPFGQQL